MPAADPRRSRGGAALDSEVAFRLAGGHLAARSIESLPPSALRESPLLPPRAVASGTLRRLQEAALLGFSERGYHGVSIRELADAAGIRVSSIYSHINAKEDLLLELMLIGHDEHRHVLLQALEGTGEDPRAQMPALVHAHVTLHATYPLLTRVCNRELHALSAPNAERVMQVRQESVELLLQPIERGVALGCFHCDEPALAAAAIGGMGIRVAEWFDPHGDVTVEAVARSYAEYSLKLLA